MAVKLRTIELRTRFDRRRIDPVQEPICIEPGHEWGIMNVPVASLT
jgi:hypothetical protein